MLKRNTIISLGVGGLIVVASVYKWFIQYQDMSQLVFGVAIGIWFMILAYFYERIAILYNHLDNMRNDMMSTQNELNKFLSWKLEYEQSHGS